MPKLMLTTFPVWFPVTLFKLTAVLTAMWASQVQAAGQAVTADSALCVPQAYVPYMLPLFQTDAALPESAYALFGNDGNYFATVRVLVTIDPKGLVCGTEAISGLDVLRKPATDVVRRFKYQPVIRNGHPARALTLAVINFKTPGKPVAPQNHAEELSALEKIRGLEKQWPRTPEQVLADMQQDLDAPGGYRRTLALPRLAKAALEADAVEKAAAYADEALTAGGGNYGEAIFYGNMVLGEIALRQGDVAEAKRRLLASGKTPGSPSLGSFGPNMTLARDLLQKGESETVLEFFTLCRAFWKRGSKTLDSWSATVRHGETPNFGANLRY